MSRWLVVFAALTLARGALGQALPSLRETLLREVGAGQPVAIFAGEQGIYAISADAVRTRTLVAQPATWATVDARADVLWFGTPGKLWAVDLASASTAAVPIATNLEEQQQVGIVYEKAGKYLERLSTRSSEYEGRIEVIFSAKAPSFRYWEGAYSVINPEAAKHSARAVRHIKISRAGKAFLQMLAKRETGKSVLLPLPTAKLPRVAAVPLENCEEQELCGEAEGVPGTALWRVIVAHSCGDACYPIFQLYDPQAKAFLDLANPQHRGTQPLTDVANVDQLWIAADGTATLLDGALYRFATGLVKDNLGHSAGWLGGEWGL